MPYVDVLEEKGGLGDDVRKLLEEGYKIWESSGMPMPPDSERYIASDALLSVYRGENAVELATACQCFRLYRRLHEMVGEYPIDATLLGDYFFSVFSKCIIPLDSVPVIDQFAVLLERDTQAAVSEEEYMSFVRGLPMVLRQ